MSTIMETYTGRCVDLSKPNPADICIEDIAWHLSRIPRFCGATVSEVPYCVAQHSVIVLNRIRQTVENPSRIMQLKALLHDGHEAYMGDPISPMSNLLDMAAPIARLKTRLQRAIYLGLVKDYEWHHDAFINLHREEIRRADCWARAYEAYHLMHSKGHKYANAVLLEEEYILRNFIVWTPAYAANSFKKYFDELI